MGAESGEWAMKVSSQGSNCPCGAKNPKKSRKKSFPLAPLGQGARFFEFAPPGPSDPLVPEGAKQVTPWQQRQRKTKRKGLSPRSRRKPRVRGVVSKGSKSQKASCDQVGDESEKLAMKVSSPGSNCPCGAKNPKNPAKSPSPPRPKGAGGPSGFFELST